MPVTPIAQSNALISAGPRRPASSHPDANPCRTGDHPRQKRIRRRRAAASQGWKPRPRQIAIALTQRLVPPRPTKATATSASSNKSIPASVIQAVAQRTPLGRTAATCIVSPSRRNSWRARSDHGKVRSRRDHAAPESTSYLTRLQASPRQGRTMSRPRVRATPEARRSRTTAPSQTGCVTSASSGRLLGRGEGSERGYHQPVVGDVYIV